MCSILKIYPAGSNGAGFAPFIGQIDVKERHDDQCDLQSTEKNFDDSFKSKIASYFGGSTTRKSRSNNGLETIVILDVSASMGSAVRLVIREILPRVLEKMGYNDSDTIKLITFSQQSKVTTQTISSLRNSHQSTESCTYMSPAIENLRYIMQTSPNKRFRIISISDGMLHDQNNAVNASTRLAQIVRESGYLVGSSAIRLYTSSSEPDTRGLASILQLDTQNTETSITDINLADYGYSHDVLADMFVANMSDKLGQSVTLTVDGKVLLQMPWSNKSDNLHLATGENTFWLNDDSLLSDGAKATLTYNFGGDREVVENVEIKVGDRLGFAAYNSVLKDKVNYFMEKLKVLKVVGTETAQSEITQIVSYFEQLEKSFSLSDAKSVDLLKNKGLHSRLAFFRDLAHKKDRSISMRMSEIANDTKVSKLNSAQQASYLRTTNVTSNAKSLAKRALKSGLDFNNVAIKEVKQMKDHLDELMDIDDSDHYTSFYSQETTLGGIHTVCQLVDSNKTIDHVSALEILQLLNIVGVPCVGPVGDFPDPKTYHINDVLLGTCVSMSDIMMVKELGNTLRDPFTDKEIINVIPFFDDDRIQKFLMKYAPTLLEYTASLGMRRLISDVPHTYKYTIVGGLYTIARRLTDSPSHRTEGNVDIFMKFIVTYKTAVNGLFDYVVPQIREPSDVEKAGNLSYYISNNGVTNMISPLITIIEENGDKIQYIPNILRALFSFEIHQVMRKFHKSDDDGYLKRKAILDKLLGIDLKKYGRPIPGYFEKEKSPKQYRTPHIDEKLYRQLIDKVFWLTTVSMLPTYIAFALRGEGDKIINMPEITKATVEKNLGIDFAIDRFKLYCIVQSFLYDTKALRIGEGVMKIEDCGNEERMNKMIGDYIEKQYRADYQSRLSQKLKEEKRILADELVDKLIKSDDYAEYVDLFRNGLERGGVKALIADQYKLGFVELRNQMFDPHIYVPMRREKLRVLVLGCDEDDAVVWNNGNVLRCYSFTTLSEKFEELGLSAEWENLKSIYRLKNLHVYRDSNLPNRHSHCNDKPSFYAYGYQTVGAYFADITQEERDAYMAVHTHCCGIWDGKLVKSA